MSTVDTFLSENQTVEHDAVQGTPEWNELRMNYDGASEAADMLNLRGDTSYAKLLRIKALGLTKEFSQFVQERIFPRGHELEALARPIVEKQLGFKLYPVTCSRGRMLSSSDGKKADGSVLWEHKQYNAELFASVQAEILPEEHWPQCQQGLFVHGADKLIFTVSDGTEENMVSMEVLPDAGLFERIILGWEKFHKDRENYKHNPVAEMPKADVSIQLPALSVSARGEIIESNLKQYGEALTVALAQTRAIVLVTDQDFSNAKEAAKMFRQQAKDIAAAKEKMLSQSVSISEAAAMMDAWVKDLNSTGLKLEKDVEREDLAKKAAMIDSAKVTFHAHIEALEVETRPIKLNITKPDFALAIKGKRSYQNMQDAIDGMLAIEQTRADSVARDIRFKLEWCKLNADGQSALLPDLQQIITKPMDDFTLTITSRIEKAKADEAARLEAETLRIRAEEEAKAQAKAKAGHDAIIAKAQAEERAKVEAEIKEEKSTLKQYEKVENLGEVIAPMIKPSAGLDAKTRERASRAEILEVLSENFGLPEEMMLDWIIAEFAGDIQFEIRKAA